MDAERLKNSRLCAGYKTARDFADYLSIPYTTYIGYEYGAREPSNEMLVRLADELGITTDYLLGLSDSPQALYISKDNLYQFQGIDIDWIELLEYQLSNGKLHKQKISKILELIARVI